MDEAFRFVEGRLAISVPTLLWALRLEEAQFRFMDFVLLTNIGMSI